jgi:hypothetical protein
MATDLRVFHRRRTSDGITGGSKPLTRRLVALATDLPARINAAHADCAKAIASAIGHAIRAGELLLRAKAGVGHGQWQKWQTGQSEVLAENRAALHVFRQPHGRKAQRRCGFAVADGRPPAAAGRSARRESGKAADRPDQCPRVRPGDSAAVYPEDCRAGRTNDRSRNG